VAEQESRGNWTWTERQEIVTEYRQSGLSQRAFCRQWGMTPSTLRNWCRRLQEDGEVESSSGVAARFVPVQLTACASDAKEAGLCLIARGGVRIEVRPGFDRVTLQRLLAAVEDAA
jgi:transposase-like protein